MTIPIVALFVLAPSFLAAPAGATTIQDLHGAQAQVATIIQRVDAAAKERDTIQSQLVGLLVKLDAGRRAIEATQARIVDQQLSMRDLSGAIGDQQAAIDQRAVQAYMQGPAGGLAILLGSTSFEDMTDRLADLDAQASLGAEASATLGTQRDQLAHSEASLQSLYRAKTAAQRRLDTEAASVGAGLQRQQAVVDGLNQDRARIEALLKRLKDRRQQELAQQALERSRSGGSNPPPEPPPGGEQMKVRDLIVYYFTPLGQPNVDTALCVGWRESRYIPTVVNPSSGAAGVYQFMPNLWPWFSSTAGWDGADVFDPVANVAVAAYIVAHFGWSPWHSDSGVCDT